MTTKTNEVEEYKKGLSDICKMSGLGMCPGCGLTPKGLEKLTALAVEKERERHAKEVNRILNLHSKPIAEGGLDYVKAFEEMERYEHRLFKSLHSDT